jgi:hypothetical protein
MILAEINGGTGNQLFQYAAAKSLALHHKVELKLNIDPENDRLMPSGLAKRPFALHHFKLPDEIADKLIIEGFIGISPFTKISDKLKPHYKRRIYREPFFHFDPDFFKAGSHVYLKGLRQSEKYFKPFENEIRAILKFGQIANPHLMAAADKIKSENSVSIHIRRNDYLAKISIEVLGLMPSEYYHRAIGTIKSKIPDASFYFFSDDISWVKENLHIPDATFVSGDFSKTDFEDLYLMSCCRHNIIANSSFSWWGAWLNNNPDKIVIAPKKWFNKGPKDTQDLIPEGWIKT